MNQRVCALGLWRSTFQQAVAVLCVALLGLGDPGLYAQQAPQPGTPAESPKISPDQLDSLVAPIALYPDPLLAQTLAAATYPLEIIQLQQWMGKHKDLKDKALADAVQKENWDPSVQAMAAFPDVIKLLAENVQWTTDLGNAFLAQQSDVMDAVQRMRGKAQGTGNLKSSDQMKVETKTVESKQVIVIEPSKPDVVYVPSYNPTVVYGAPPVYAYPPVAYPPPGYYAAGMAISFGVGMMMGAAWGGGGWGWGCGWGGNNTININNNNNFVRNSNIQGGNNIRGGNNVRGGNTWQHNAQHRGGAPYGDRSTANRFGGTTRGDSLGNRQASARQNIGRQQTGVSDRASGVAGNNRGGRSDFGGNSGNRGAGVGNTDRGGGNRGSGIGSADRSSPGGDRVGNRQVSNDRGSRNSGAFGGSGGFSGSSARASGSRGASSMGGGSRGGGSRGGGGRRR